MARLPKPFVITKRNNANTFQFTLNHAYGLHERVCKEWRRKGFHDLPTELAQYRNPKDKKEAEDSVIALILYLKKKQEEGSARRVAIENITVGKWIEKFTAIETSPRTGMNAAKNRPYSVGTISSYKGYYDIHINGDPISQLSITEVQEEDVLEYATRLSLKKTNSGRVMAGTRTFAGVLGLVRMAFREYQRRNSRWTNPMQCLEKPVYNKKNRDALQEEEVLALYKPGVLQSAMEKAVCSAMFLSGLRRSEILALKPEDLDWLTPKITVRRTSVVRQKSSALPKARKKDKRHLIPFYRKQ
jgi:integrase